MSETRKSLSFEMATDLSVVNYPQIPFLMLGLSNAGNKVSDWSVIWPEFYRAHWNQQQVLELLTEAVNACHNLVSYPGIWSHPLSGDFLAIGGPKRTQQGPPERNFDPADLLIGVPHEGYWSKYREAANKLRRKGWGICFPYIFSLLAVKDRIYAITEPIKDPTLAEVLQNPDIYERDLPTIIGYIRDVANHPSSSFLITTPDKITLRPTPKDCECIIGPDNQIYPVWYVPIFHYYLNQEPITLEDLADQLGNYREIFESDDIFHVDNRRYGKVFEPANDLDIVNQSQLFKQARKADSVDDIWYRLTFGLDLGWERSHEKIAAKLKKWQKFQYTRYRALKAKPGDYNQDMSELLLAGYNAGLAEGYFEAKASVVRTTGNVKTIRTKK